MIDHVSVAVSDLARSAAFYERVLAPLGLARIVERPATVGFGKAYPEVWLNHRPAVVPVAGTGNHVALRAPDEAAVRAFHAAALALGGSNDGEPGPRRGEKSAYYGAFILDPDGNKIEAVTFARKL